MLELLTYYGDYSEGIAAFDGDRLISQLITSYDSPEDNTISRLRIAEFIIDIVQACNQHVDIVENTITEDEWDSKVS